MKKNQTSNFKKLACGCAILTTIASSLFYTGCALSYNDAPYASRVDWNTESYAHIEETGFSSPLRAPLSTFSVDVDVASYYILKYFVKEGKLPDAYGIRAEEYINAFQYHYPQPTGNDAIAISSELSVCPWNQQHLLARIGVQSKKIPIDALPPSNLVFLIDVSGSMAWDESRLPLVKSSLCMLVDNMRACDRVAIVTYASGTKLVLPSTSCMNKKEIKTAIENLRAGGGTYGSAGIDLAYEQALKNFNPKANNRVIIATDGDFNIGGSSQSALIQQIKEKRKTGVYLTVLGYGMGNYKDDRLELLSNHGNGNYAYINEIMSAKKVLIKEFGSTLWVVAKDVKLQVEFNPEKVDSYRLVGYENRRLMTEDFVNDAKDAGDMGAGHTVTALYELIPSTSSSVKVEKNRYTITQPTTASSSQEFMFVKVRYKHPNDDVSHQIVSPITNFIDSISKTSDDFRFASAVAQTAQILRNSPFKGAMTLEDVLAQAKSAKGADPECERAEFIQLVEKIITNRSIQVQLEKQEK